VIRLFTIGFTKKTAEKFFGLLRDARVTRVIDTRLNRKSQLAGFAKEQDLKFLVPTVCNADYVVEPTLAPTDDILSAYKKRTMGWEQYSEEFLRLLESRQIENKLGRSLFDGACLLCSEDKPHHCHRRLVAEYLKQRWGDIEIHHL